MRVLQTILVILITAVFFPIALAFARPQPIYTIQVIRSSNFKMAKKLTTRIAHLLPLPVRLEKIGRYYIVRAGVAEKRESLKPYLEKVRRLGYSQAFLRSAYYLKNRIILEINSSKKSPSEKGQPYLLRLIQKQQPGTGLIQMPVKHKPRPAYRKRRYHFNKGKYFLIKAWQYYKRRDYDKAVMLFKRASKYRSTRLEAELGLAYCYFQQNKNERAISLLEKLVKQSFRPKETVPNLIALLVQKGDYDKAKLYLTKLKGKERKKWQEEIEEAIIKQRFQKAQKKKDIKGLIKLTRTYEKALKLCIEPNLFYDIAQRLAQGGAKKEAINIYTSLLSCAHDLNLRLGIFYKLKSLLPPATLQALIENEMKQPNLPLDYKERLMTLKLYILKERLAGLSPSAPETEKLARKILNVKPKDLSTLTALPWWYYHHKQYAAAYKLFSYLHKEYPQKKDYALGLAYTLMKLNKLGEALKIAKDFGFKDVESEIYLRKANEAYRNKDYPKAEFYLQKVLTLDHQNLNAKMLLAWTLYNQGKIEESLPMLKSVYQKDPNAARAMLHIYEKLNQKEKAFSFANCLAQRNKDVFKKIAADFFFAHDCPIKAAQTYTAPDTCYYHADKPWIDFSPFYRHKSGDSGLSQLNEFVFPLTFSYPYYWGKKWEFSLIPERLSSGNAPSLPYAGTYDCNYPHQKHDLITSLWVITPQIKWESEGDTHYTFQLGTTPLNGPISPLPTFLAEINRGDWRLNLHQYPVKESILSYVGLKDPYSNKKWGRVVRSGVEGEKIFTFPTSYWLSLKGGFDDYWGKNVWNNYAFYGTAAFGRTFSNRNGNLSIGTFATAKHFQHNTDFFTYGHGGYFSPKAFLMAGPLLHFQTKRCKTYWLDVQLGAGYLYFRTDDAPKYPLTDCEKLKDYKGDHHSLLGYNMQLQGLKLLSHHWAGGVFFSLNKSADYTEYYIGLALRYFFAPRSNLSPDINKSRPQ